MISKRFFSSGVKWSDLFNMSVKEVVLHAWGRKGEVSIEKTEGGYSPDWEINNHKIVMVGENTTQQDIKQKLEKLQEYQKARKANIGVLVLPNEMEDRILEELSKTTPLGIFVVRQIELAFLLMAVRRIIEGGNSGLSKAFSRC